MPRLSSRSLAVKCLWREPEQLHLARRLEEDRSRLHGMGRVVQLLGEVETVMEGAGWLSLLPNSLMPCSSAHVFE